MMRKLWPSNSSRVAALSVMALTSLMTGVILGDEDEAKLERARVMKEMHAMADAIIVSRRGTDEIVERIKTPIFRYNSPSRLYQDGSIWAWGKKGRPLVVMEMFTLNAKEPTWIHGCVLTSTQLVDATRLGEKIWYPRELGIQFKEFPGNTPAPGKTKKLRLRQMKLLSRRFKAHQFWDPDNTRFDLRLLVNPVYRYQDPGAGIVDGCLFLMAHEIEPEVIIMIEAAKNNGGMVWRHAVTPIGSAEFHMFLDDDRVYHRERTPMRTGYPVDPYHSIHVQALRD